LFIRFLAYFALNLFYFSFGFHLLIVDDVSDAVFHCAHDFFHFAFHAFCALGNFLTCLAFYCFGGTFGFHLLVAE